MTSNGGAFGYATTGDSNLEPLPDGVQVMQVTDNGPVLESAGNYGPVQAAGQRPVNGMPRYRVLW